MSDNYPAFKKWFGIQDWILQRCEAYPKSVRFTLSGRIYNLSLDVLENIIETIYSKKKKVKLYKINTELEKLRIMFRISHDRRYISVKQYEYISSEINEFGRMIGGWIKSCAE